MRLSNQLLDDVSALRDNGYLLRRGFVGTATLRAALDYASRLSWAEASDVSARVRQRLEQATIDASTAPLIVQEVRGQIERLVASLGIEQWRAEEITFTRYEGPMAGISAHRDSARYQGAVAVLTLTGRASVTMLATRRGPTIDSWHSSPGDLLVIAGSDPAVSADPRPFHRVGPPLNGPRIVLAARWAPVGHFC